MAGAYDYSSKLISVEQALSKIKSDDCIVSALGAAEPNGLLDQLHTIAPRVTVPFLRRAVTMKVESFRRSSSWNFLLPACLN